MDSTEFFGGDAPAVDPQGYDRYGRYLLDADGTGPKPYTRATTLAKTLDDGRGIAVYGQRKAAKGVAVSPALTARAAVTPLDDRAAWREIIDQAEVKSGGDEKRDLGTAFHAFHEHVGDMTDDEYAAVPHELRVTYERYRAELARLGIEEVLTEFTCVNQAIGTAGKADALFRLADGRLVIGDRKTGNVVKYPHAPAVQFAIYANADTMVTFDDSGAQVRQPMPEVDKAMALVVDITIGDEITAAVHVYEVDIWAGWYGALLAGQVRRWRNRKDLIRPYHPELQPAEPVKVAQPVSRELIGEVPPTRVVTDSSGVEWVPPADATIEDVTKAVGPEAMALPENQAWFEKDAVSGQAPPVEPADRPEANERNMSATAKAVLGIGPPLGSTGLHPAWSSKDQKVIQLDSKGERVDEVKPGPDALDDAADLLATFKTKAAMQDVGRRVGLTNLSRTRANLAKDIVSHEAWPSLRAALLPGDPVARVQEASDEAAAIYAGISETGDGVDVLPEAPLSDEAAIKDMHERTTTEVFSPVVSNTPGPVPPDPEPTITVTGPAQYPTVGGVPVKVGETNPFRPAEPVKTPEDELAERIANATSHSELADIWDQAVNIMAIGWPPRLHQAATIRAKQISEQQ
jgi:hypothetical protein